MKRIDPLLALVSLLGIIICVGGLGYVAYLFVSVIFLGAAGCQPTSCL
jgi:hypothetical protein